MSPPITVLVSLWSDMWLAHSLGSSMSHLQTTDYMWLPLRMKINADTCLSVETFSRLVKQAHSLTRSVFPVFYSYCAPETLIFIVCMTKLQIEAIADQTVRMASKLIIFDVSHSVIFTSMDRQSEPVSFFSPLTLKHDYILSVCSQTLFKLTELYFKFKWRSLQWYFDRSDKSESKESLTREAAGCAAVKQ